MGRIAISAVVAVLVTVAIAACSADTGSPRGPGSVTVYLHGRVEATFGASSH